MQAAWDAKNTAPGGEQAMRYTSELVDALKAEPAAAPTVNAVMFRLRLANALRELGRFDEASATLAATAIPGELEPDGAFDGDGPAEVRWWLADFKAQLAVAVARRDAARNPPDLQDQRSAAMAMRCVQPDFPKYFPDAEPLTALEADYCASPKLREKIEEIRAMIDEYWG